MATISIGEAARRAGVNTSTIRYYESIGLLPKAQRVNKQRRIDESVLHWLGLIQFAQQAGFTLAEIEVLFHGFAAHTPPSERWQALAEQKLPELDALIQRAEHMKRLIELSLKCNCVSLDECGLDGSSVEGQ